MGWTRAKTLLGASSSTLSSAPYFIGNAETLSVSIISSTASASNITLRGSNADGLQAAIPNASWSVLTVLPAAGNYVVERGLRWLLAERADIAVSAASNTTVLLHQFVQR